MMTRELTVLILISGVLATGPALAETTTGAPVQVVTTEHADFAPGGTIRLNNSFGDLTVEAWDQPRVEITVTKSMGYGIAASEAKRGLDSVQVATTHPSGTEMAITTTRTRIYNRFTHALGFGRDVTMEYRIRVPRNSHLIINHDSGEVSVIGVTGAVEATSRKGDIILLVPDLAAYSIDAHTKIGVVSSDVAGTTHNRHKMGEDFSHGDASLPHKLVLHMGAGGITMKELAQAAPAAVPAK